MDEFDFGSRAFTGTFTKRRRAEIISLSELIGRLHGDVNHERPWRPGFDGGDRRHGRSGIPRRKLDRRAFARYRRSPQRHALNSQSRFCFICRPIAPSKPFDQPAGTRTRTRHADAAGSSGKLLAGVSADRVADIFRVLTLFIPADHEFGGQFRIAGAVQWWNVSPCKLLTW
jgi:hypothetical protein